MKALSGEAGAPFTPFHPAVCHALHRLQHAREALRPRRQRQEDQHVEQPAQGRGQGEEEQGLKAVLQGVHEAILRPKDCPHLWVLAKPTKYERALLSILRPKMIINANI